jgi:methionyl-tRNA formyltransferase
MRVVYFGTPDFAVEVLAFLISHRVEVVGVVTQPPRPKGRSGEPQQTSVAAAVRANYPSTPLIEVEEASEEGAIEQLRALEADLFVVVAFGQFLGKRLRETPRLGCINLHPSLLPKYRGAAPIQRALMNGDLETGVTIMTVVREMDAGDIIRQVSTPIGRHETLAELESRLCIMGAELLLQVIADFERGEVSYTPQDPTQVVLAPKVSSEDGELKWSEGVEAVFNRFRGVTPRPGAWCRVWLRGVEKRLKVLACRPGSVGRLLVPCPDGFLTLDQVQLEGKKPLAADEFLRGYLPQEIVFK